MSEDIPSTCQNPKENCHRTPVRKVVWPKVKEANLDDSVNETWLCEQCWQMLLVGSMLRRNEITHSGFNPDAIEVQEEMELEG